MISWFEYLLICTAGVLVASRIIGWRHVINIRNYPAAFFLLMYITYALRPYASYVFGDGLVLFDLLLPGISYMADRDKAIIAVVFCLAVVFFAIGYRIVRPNEVNRLTSAYTNLKCSGQVNPIYLRVSLLVIFIGYSSFLIARRGFLGYGDRNIEYVVTKSGTILGNTSGYIELANYLVITGILLYYANSRKLHWTLLIVAPWVLNQVYFGWARYLLIVLGLGLMGVWLFQNRDNRVFIKQGIIVIPIAIASVFLLLLMRTNREFIKRGESVGSLVEGMQTTSIDNAIGDFSGFEGTWFVISTINYRKPLYGSSIIYNLFVKPVPRILWNGKLLVREFTWYDIFNHYSYESYLYSILGESEDLWYAGAVRGSIGFALEEWGWAGLAINFIITGLFLGWIQNRVSTAQASNPVWIATYAATYGMIGLLGRNDLFSVLTNHIFLFYLPYALLNIWVQRYHRLELITT